MRPPTRDRLATGRVGELRPRDTEPDQTDRQHRPVPDADIRLNRSNMRSRDRARVIVRPVRCSRSRTARDSRRPTGRSGAGRRSRMKSFGRVVMWSPTGADTARARPQRERGVDPTRPTESGTLRASVLAPLRRRFIWWRPQAREDPGYSRDDDGRHNESPQKHQHRQTCEHRKDAGHEPMGLYGSGKRHLSPLLLVRTHPRPASRPSWCDVLRLAGRRRSPLKHAPLTTPKLMLVPEQPRRHCPSDRPREA